MHHRAPSDPCTRRGKGRSCQAGPRADGRKVSCVSPGPRERAVLQGCVATDRNFDILDRVTWLDDDFDNLVLSLLLAALTLRLATTGRCPACEKGSCTLFGCRGDRLGRIDNDNIDRTLRRFAQSSSDGVSEGTFREVGQEQFYVPSAPAHLARPHASFPRVDQVRLFVLDENGWPVVVAVNSGRAISATIRQKVSNSNGTLTHTVERISHSRT